MTKEQQIAGIRERRGFRKMREGMFPEWMEKTLAYLAKQDELDSERIHYIRCGITIK